MTPNVNAHPTRVSSASGVVRSAYCQGRRQFLVPSAVTPIPIGTRRLAPWRRRLDLGPAATPETRLKPYSKPGLGYLSM